MFTKNIYWWFESIIPPEKCKQIIKYIDIQIEKNGTQAEIESANSGVYGLEDDYRKTEIAFSNSEWLYDLVLPYTHTANKNAGWNFDIDITEKVQLTKYHPNNFYNTHTDGNGDCLSGFKNFDNRVRKLSTVVNVTNDSDYTGGEFEITYLDSRGNLKNEVIQLKQGSVIVFPSHLHHKVKPVISGTRYSLVFWSLGKPFK